MVKPGFGLIEVIVALTLLSAGLLGVAASAGLAVRLMREAQADEQAALAAMEVLDSLTRLYAPTAGTRRAGRTNLIWTVQSDSSGNSTIEVAATYPDGALLRTAIFRALSAVQ